MLAVTMAFALGAVAAVRTAAVVHHAGAFLVERLLLLGLERGVERLGGFATAFHFSGALCVHRAHAVDALGRGQLFHALVVETGVVGLVSRVHCGLEGIPCRLLVCRDLQFLLEGGRALGHAFLALLGSHAGAALVLAMGRLGVRWCGCGGSGWRGRVLLRHGRDCGSRKHGSSQNGGGESTGRKACHDDFPS